MDPAALSATRALTQALWMQQGLPPGEAQALVRALGQEVILHYLGQGPDGAKLALPGGQVVTAQGELPFPPGTEVRARVSLDNGQIKLQPLETVLPEAPELLAPLTRSESQGLLGQLKAQEPAPALEPLVRVLQTLLGEEPRPLPQTKGPETVLSHAESAHVAQALKASAAPAPQVPETWEAWVKGSVRALADPSLSPKEAPFHALQAQERTGYFEIPLPWTGAAPLQLWVEEDAAPAESVQAERPTRVLMGLHLSRLGELRLGLQRLGSSLAVRVWTEHPERVEALREPVERDLAAIASQVDLRILPLEASGQGIPEVAALVRGSRWHVLT